LSSKYLILGIIAGRTEVIVHQMSENAVPSQPLKADEHPVQENPDPSKVITAM
jgi:hypothetical protein